MPTTTNRDTASRGDGSVDDRLARLLETPRLAQIVPDLAPETLHQLIRYRGLEACGELLAAATPAQLTSLLDLDLWRRARAGRDERFDADRFGEWLEVLVDTGDAVAARTVAALDTDLVVAGLSRYVRVFDPGTFEPTASTDDEPMDRHAMMNSETIGDLLECEVGGYLVRSRRLDAWDTIVALLVALDTDHNRCFHAVMQGCRRLSHSRPEIDGLDDRLAAPDQHLHDVGIERDRRRSRHGYATPADAHAFLQMARQPAAPISTNPIAAAYFRAVEDDAGPQSERTRAGAPDSAPHHADNDIATSVDAVLDLLAEAVRLRQDHGGPGLIPERPQALLEAANEERQGARLPLLTRLTAFVRHHDETAFLNRSRELAFLANTLLAGSSIQSRPFTPREASDAAASICHLGLDSWPSRWPLTSSQPVSSSREPDTAPPPDAFLVDHDLVTTFAVGWSVLYEDVSLFVADQLVTTLTDLDGVDGETRRGLQALRRTLVEQRRAGTPWLARGAADVLATLDLTAWISVLGLLDECPILPAALPAILDRRTTAVSPTAFDFISTTAQIGDVRLFTRMLPALLSR